MALADPQVITVNAVAQSLKRVSSGTNVGTFKTNDGNFTLDVAHSYSKRNRHTLVLRQRKIAADPLAPTLNVEVTLRASFSWTVLQPGWLQRPVPSRLSSWAERTRSSDDER